MNIYCLGTLFTQLTLGLNAFITAQGKTLISMCNVAVGVVTNIILDAVFINGVGMGVKGAALATVISQGAQLLLSYNLGAENISGVKKTFRLLLIRCVSGSFLIWFICITLPLRVASVFTTDETLIVYTMKSMRVYLAMLLIYGIQVACQYSFVALDQAPKAIFLTIWRKIIILIPLIFILPHFVPDAVMGYIWLNRLQTPLQCCTTAPMFYSYYRKLKC